MWNASLLAIIDEAGSAVLTLTEGLEEEEFLDSRITRAEVQRQIGLIAQALDGLDENARGVIPEIDWSAWRATRERAPDAQAENETIWFAVRSLVPATLMWLRLYRRNQPELFEFKP